MKNLFTTILSIGKLSILLPLLFAATGCEKRFLSEENASAITQEDYFYKEEHAEQAINGIYPSLRALQTGWDSWTIDFPVGHANSAVTGTPRLILHQYDEFEGPFNTLWTNYYYGIANANLAIQKIPGIEMDAGKKKRLLGEAHFLRAWFYFYMVRLYGDIPLITDPVDFTSENLYPQRSSTASVYDLVLSDLKEAELSGLPNTDQTGRVSLGAVKSLLANVYLTMAGYPLNKGASYYQLAAEKAAEVLDAKWYNLFDNYAHLHDRAHKNTGELIFQTQYKAGIISNDITERITPATIGISKLSNEWGQITPRNEFVASYEEGDLRVQEKQFFFSEYPIKGTTQVRKFGEYALYKFWLEEAAGESGDGNGDINFTLIRLPEVMLIYAEAANETDGPTEKAYEMLNAIRKRAQIKELAGLSKSAFREAVWRERYHELCFENKAYFDIQRTRKAFNLKTGSFEDILEYKNESGVTFRERDLLWPIPGTQIDINPKLTPNPGW